MFVSLAITIISFAFHQKLVTSERAAAKALQKWSSHPAVYKKSKNSTSTKLKLVSLTETSGL